MMKQIEEEEESLPQISPVNEVARATELSLVNAIQEDWTKRYYSSCLHNLRTLKGVTQPASVQILASILMPPKEQKMVTRRNKNLVIAIQELALTHLIESPSPEAITPLVTALFHSNNSIASTAEAALQLKGAPIVPSLLDVLMQPKLPYYWTERGIVAMLHLLRAYGDSHASNALIHVAQKQLPIGSNAPLVSAFYIGIAVSSFFMIPMGIHALATSIANGSLSLLSFFLSFFGWLVSYIGLTIAIVLPLLCLMFPFLLNRENRHQRRFSSLALQALKQIKDKQTLSPLIRLTWHPPLKHNQEALDALESILPLITKEDASLLSFSSDEELLCNALGKHSTSVTLSILHTLECIGTETSLHRLKRVASHSELAEVRERASAVYEAVKARAELKREMQVLLRASHAPQETTDLLRPAQDAPLEGRDELLHPAAPPIEQGGTSHAETD